MSGDCRREPTSRTLPAWSSTLAVVAHPDDESLGLGAVLNHSSGRGPDFGAVLDPCRGFPRARRCGQPRRGAWSGIGGRCPDIGCC